MKFVYRSANVRLQDMNIIIYTIDEPIEYKLMPRLSEDLKD